MSLDPELKAEIERRVAAGEVTRCPPRTYALDAAETVHWKDGREAGRRISERQRRFQAAEARRRRLEEAGAAISAAAKAPEAAPRAASPRPAPETAPARGLSAVWPFRAHRAVAELPLALCEQSEVGPALPPEARRPEAGATPPAAPPALAEQALRGDAPPAAAARLRPVAPVSDRNLTPRAPGPRPALRWIPLSRLAVSEAYQRNMAERSVTMIRRAVEGFDWARLKPLSVAARADGWFEVLDGQHTATILLMAGETEAPCLVLPDAAEAEKAEAFVGLNSSRVQVTPMQRHHAAVAAGRAEALAVEAACRAAGARLLRNAKQAGKYLPGETVAVPALTAIAGRRGEAGLARVLAPLVAAGLAPIPTDAVLAAELLLFDAAWAGEIGEAAIAGAFGDLKARQAEAESIRARAPQPRPRALAAAVFRAAGR